MHWSDFLCPAAELFSSKCAICSEQSWIIFVRSHEVSQSDWPVLVPSLLWQGMESVCLSGLKEKSQDVFFQFHPQMQNFYLPFWSQKIQVNEGKYSTLLKLYMCDFVLLGNGILAPVVPVAPVAPVVRVCYIQQPYFTLCCAVCDCVCDNTAWFDWLIRRWAVDWVRRWRWSCSICACRSSEPPVGRQTQQSVSNNSETFYE